MARRTTAGVFLGDRRVGTLSFESEVTRFEYTDVSPDHPVLGQAFEDDPAGVRVSRMDVPPWFSNLLPEQDTPLRRLITDQFGVKSVRSFPLLLALGEDLPGAVAVRLDGDARTSAPECSRSAASTAARVHIEDLAQIREVSPRKKYDNTTYDAIGRVVMALTGPAGLAEYVRRLVVCIAIGNADAHLKNWSIIYPDGRTPALAPAYDLVSVTVYERFSTDQLAFRLAGERAFDKLDRDHFRRLADAVDADPDEVVHIVDQTVVGLRDSWPSIVANHPVPDFLRTYLDDRLRRLRLLQDP
jgi:HipA-like protein